MNISLSTSSRATNYKPPFRKAAKAVELDIKALKAEIDIDERKLKAKRSMLEELNAKLLHYTKKGH